MTPWGENIARMIREQKLKQGQVAERAGLNPSRLSDIINKDDTNPNIRTLERIAQALGVPVSELLRQPGGSPDAVTRPDTRVHLQSELRDMLIELLREVYAALVRAKAREESDAANARRSATGDGGDGPEPAA